jgi:stress response protein YsnF
MRAHALSPAASGAARPSAPNKRPRDHFAVNRVVDAPSAIRQEGDTIIVPVLEEIMVVEKRLLLKEEIHIRCQEVMQHVSQPVRLRSKEVSLERPPLTNPSNREDET